MSPPDDRFDAALIFAFVFIVVMAMGTLAFVNIPDKNQTLFTTLVTGIVGFLGVYVGYRWGSSKKVDGQ